MNINNINLDDDEIDLRDFFVTLWKKKLLLLFLTSVFAIFSVTLILLIQYTIE